MIASRPRTRAYRRDPLWISALVHRLSGVALAVFLPLHFLVLGLALDLEARLDGFLRWTDQPLVKAAEAGLIALLAVHLLGGLRLLAADLGASRGGQKALATAVFGAAAVAGVAFLVAAR